MAVDLLDAPLRVSWDLCLSGAPILSADQLLHVARSLQEAGVFFVLLENSPLRHPAILPLLEELSAGGCQLALVTDGSPRERDLLKSAPGGTTVFLDVAGYVCEGRLESDRLQADYARLVDVAQSLSLLWMPRSGQLTLVPELLSLCRDLGCAQIKLPNQKIGVNSEREKPLLPSCEDLQQLAGRIADSGLSDLGEVKLEVHDLFIWELLQPLAGGQRSEYGGCQAANSLGHITADAVLFPCSSWPEPLGDLLQNNLLDLWQSSGRLHIRDEIMKVPVGCEECRDYQICFGGCRGLSRFCQENGTQRDLLCPGRR